MRKRLSLSILTIMIVSLFVGCAKGSTAAKNNTQVEKDTTTASEIVKFGVGHEVNINKSKDKGDSNPATAAADAYVAAVGFDKDGKIVQIKIDATQGKLEFDENLAPSIPLDTKFKSKNELGEEYGMKKASEIGKEWNEQAKAFADWTVGKTAEEVANMKTKFKDDKHPNVADEPDLVSSVTIDVGTFQKIVSEAWEKAVDVKGVENIGLGLQNNIKRSKAKTDEKAALGLFEVTIVGLALDKDSKVVDAYLDMAMAQTDFDENGKITNTDKNVGTKQEIKEEYGMKKASVLGKEWHEHANSLAEWMKGKAESEILSMEVKEKDPMHPAVPTSPDLTSSVTITVEEILPAAELAFNSVK